MKPPVDAPTSRQSSTSRVDAGRIERVRELLPSPRDVRRRRGDREVGRLVHLLARLLVPGNEAREHERLRLRAALGEPALDQQHVQALLRQRLYCAAESTASQASSEATTPSAVVSSSGSLSKAPVDTAKSTSPSSSAWNGWIARAIEACT